MTTIYMPKGVAPTCFSQNILTKQCIICFRIIQTQVIWRNSRQKDEH